MKIPAFVNVLLATALVVLSIKITFGDSAETDSHSGGRGVSDGITSATSRVSSASAYDMILSRTSIREYADRAVGSETVDSLLKAGMAAPTAGNRQPWKFIVVDDSSLIASIGSAAKAWAPVGRAPIAIIVCGDKSAAFDGALSIGYRIVLQCLKIYCFPRILWGWVPCGADVIRRKTVRNL